MASYRRKYGPLSDKQVRWIFGVYIAYHFSGYKEVQNSASLMVNFMAGCANEYWHATWRHQPPSCLRYNDVSCVTFPAVKCKHARLGLGMYCPHCATGEVTFEDTVYLKDLANALQWLKPEYFKLAVEISSKFIVN